MKKNVTIYEIAEKLQISPSTVSRVLSNSSHPIKPEMRERILTTAKEMDYFPNAQARYLKNQTNPTIGVVIPSIDNPFYPTIVRGIEDEALSRDYFITLCSCDREINRTDLYVQKMLEQSVRGIIGIFLDYMPPSLVNYARRGGHVVAVVSEGRTFEGAHNIIVDKIGESRKATEHMLSLGHKRIAMLMNTMSCQLRYDKVDGYKNALAQAGIEFNEDYLYIYGRDAVSEKMHPSDADVGYALAKKLLTTTPEVTGIICMNDIIALGAVAALKESNKAIPADYSVSGFDDSFFAGLVDPSLTTMAIDKYQWGQSLTQYLFNVIENPTGDATVFVPENKLLTTSELVVRSSTAQPRE